MLDEKSVEKLAGVHPDLVRVVNRAGEAKDIAFVVTEGLRSLKRQRELIAAGASTTLRSRHLTGHAVDLAVKVGDEIRWDWPLYAELAEVVKRSARQEGVTIEWGGDWRSFKDGPHFQLPWSAYPL